MINITEKEKVEKLRRAKSASGGTSFVTKYVPGGMSMDLVRSDLSKELGPAQHIKSKDVKKDVTIALKSGLQEIKFESKYAPENGLVLCSGIQQPCI